jgi:signal transduction histidine kinase
MRAMDDRPGAAQAVTPRLPAGMVWALIAFACVYPLLDWVSYIYPMARFNITPWNPQPALAIALLMLYGQRTLPVVALTILLSENLVRHSATPWLADILVALVLSLCYGAIANALTQRYAVAPRLDSTRDVLRLVAVVILGTLPTGVLYVGALTALDAGPLERLPEAFLRFWIGDSVGMLVFLPLVLMLSDAERRAGLKRMLARGETLAQGISIAAILLFVFTQNLAEQVKFFYLLFLPLAWASARAGLMGSATAALLIQTGVIAAVHFTGQPPLTVFELQGFLIAMTIMGLFLGVTVDERAQAELALRQSQKLAAAGQMAAALTHELSQPLTALANYARAGQVLLMAGERERARLEDTMGKLVEQSRRAADVVRGLRDFLQHGTMHMAPVSLDALALRVADALRAGAAAEGVALRCEPGGAVATALADALQIEIVLRNLLRNAIEAAREAPPERRAVELSIVQVAADTLRLTVADTGPGLRPEQVEQIFEPFETSKARGMGMGLTISRAIVEAHRGRLWAESGERGIFHVELPTGEHEDE